MDVYDPTQNLNKEWSSPIRQENSQLQKFYKDSKVFVTGGTGFLGKVLIEKLLRCTEVSTIYLLVREKKGKDTHTRIDEMFDDVLFDKLSLQTPKFKHKIVVVPGDCGAAGLGITITDRQTLVKNVDVVFHAAATVNFDENLKKAFAIHVKATETLVNLCKEIENLKAFVHVSTAYSNCHLDLIDEKFYEYPVSYKDVELALEKLDESSVETCTPKILGEWPNTYTFTKALAEQMINDTSCGLPTAIFRPAIVISTYREPIEGWIDNTNGPTGVCAGAMAGVLRTVFSKDEAHANVVPVDMCVSAVLASAWDVATKKRQQSDVPIYNYVSNCENPITWGEFTMLNKKYAQDFPSSNAIWCINMITTTNRQVHAFSKILCHYLPAVFLDGLSLLLGKRPKLIKLYRKIHRYVAAVSYFATRNWDFTNQNVQVLWNNMNERDRELFPFSLTEVHWLNYCKRYVLGIRSLLLKDHVDTLKQARIKQSRFFALQRLLRYTLTILSGSILWSCLHRLTTWIFTNKMLI